ncbi:MAG: TRAP transporter large permease [Litorivicinaceae bacterium]
MADAILMGIAGVIALLALGFPVFLAFLVVNLLLVLLVLGPMGFGMFVNSMVNTASTQALSTIPLFILMGELIFRAGAVEKLFASIQLLIGQVRGRQHVITMVLSTILSALSGASMAVAAMLGRTVLPTLLAGGHSVRLSAGTILAGASLAPIVPPSVLVIILGTLAEESIAKLLIAGVLPGLVLAAVFIAYIVWKSPADDPEAAQREPTGSASVGAALLDVLPLTLLILFVLGAILSGIATPTEAAATGVFGALIVCRLYGVLNWSLIEQATIESAKLGSMILLIMITSKLFSQLLAMSGVASMIASVVTGLSEQPYVILFVLMAIPFVLCMLIDQIALLLIIVPIYKQLLDFLPIEPLVFWFLLLVNITIGGITPPFGYTLFALRGANQSVSMPQIYQAVWPFIGLYLLFMVLVVFWPGLVTFLPNRM